ncbi:MAG TPA: hypothetical protein VKH42_21100 [Vicinamibacterales bacterium]|nr:hypothetical protein [Vicinamibacterales bacterium]
MTRAILIVLALAAAAADQRQQTFAGVITDSECSSADHSHMRMGPTDAECVKACISEHGASYVLYDGKNSYTLSDQKMAERFAAKKVVVAGTLDPKTKRIQVASIKDGR